jgi:hypothetical protein
MEVLRHDQWPSDTDFVASNAMRTMVPRHNQTITCPKLVDLINYDGRA